MATDDGDETGTDGENGDETASGGDVRDETGTEADVGAETDPGAADVGAESGAETEVGTAAGSTAAGEPGGVDYEVSDVDRTWGILAHVSSLAGFFVPFGNVLGPLLVWLIKKDESRFVDENGKESLNFQITWTVLFVFSLFTILIGVGLLLVPLVMLAWLILVVLATVRASEGEVYDYPLTVDLVS